MYTLVAAPHALKNNTVSPTEMSLGECQDSSRLDADLIRGKILVCSYSVRFVLGLSSVKQALDTANNVSAAGVIFYLDPFVLGFQLNPTPMRMPGLIIPSSDDSKVGQPRANAATQFSYCFFLFCVFRFCFAEDWPNMIIYLTQFLEFYPLLFRLFRQLVW